VGTVSAEGVGGTVGVDRVSQGGTVGGEGRVSAEGGGGTVGRDVVNRGYHLPHKFLNFHYFLRHIF